MSQEKTPENVAREATITADVPRSGPILLGTFGREETPAALVRLPGGRVTVVNTGDRVAGNTVIAIEEGRLALDKSGRADWLEMPG